MIEDSMNKIQGQKADVFAIVKKMNNLYLMQCKESWDSSVDILQWTNSPGVYVLWPIWQQEEGNQGNIDALGHLLFKMVVGLAEWCK